MKHLSMVAVLVAGFALPAAAQNFGDLFSSDLVHWSYMQEPQQPEGRPPAAHAFTHARTDT